MMSIADAFWLALNPNLTLTLTLVVVWTTGLSYRCKDFERGIEEDYMVEENILLSTDYAIFCDVCENQTSC